MATPRKGSRLIKVDGVLYRWRVRHKPTYGQGLVGNSGITFSVELNTNGGSKLVVDTERPRMDNWMGAASAAVTPSDVAKAVRSARKNGWFPKEPGKPFEMRLPQERDAADSAQSDF